LFPEPQDAASGNNLGNYMAENLADWYGYFNSLTPGVSNYSNNLDIYVHFSGWTTPVDEFITPVTSFTGPIRQSIGSGTDSFGCSQNQYTFGTIEVSTSDVTVGQQYFYSIWIPLAGVGGSMTNMTVDIGSGAPCATNLLSDGIPDSTLAGTNVTVTSGAAIPAGTYRVLWLGSFAVQPSSPPLTAALYFKGDTKS
jgi:hypothetical protein